MIRETTCEIENESADTKPTSFMLSSPIRRVKGKGAMRQLSHIFQNKQRFTVIAVWVVLASDEYLVARLPCRIWMSGVAFHVVKSNLQFCVIQREPPPVRAGE